MGKLRMLPTFWRDVLKDGWRVSNCKIISREKKETLTHKIVLAAKSEFFKTILSDIPEGHDAVIILPDFTCNEIEIFMQKIISESKMVSSLWNMIVKEEEPNIIQLENGEESKGDEKCLDTNGEEIIDKQHVAIEQAMTC
eukprot:TRINITY_DN32529_c0_g1_i1.p1 TRINITY_DN32529_c0_g1~~TRINITY_DN32529_c0_g1_i1.p1  ORF type:complete len:148 (-),score=38.13 TRINITY_DN32529_c0_g1_i1:66-485(-)